MIQSRVGWFHRHDIVPELAVLLLAAIYAGQYATWALSVLVIVILTAYKKGSISSPTIYGGYAMLGMIIIGLVMGTAELLDSKTTLWYVLRDLIRATVLPLFWFAFSMAASENKRATRSTFYRTLFFTCALAAVIDLVVSLPARIAAIPLGFSEFTEAYRSEELVLAFGFFLSLVNPIGKKARYISRFADPILKFAIIINFAMAFSRTALVMMIIFVIPFVIRKGSTAVKFVTVVAAAAVVVWIAVPDIATYFYDKIVNSVSELGTAHEWTDYDIVHNWRGYEMYCMQNHFNASDTVNMIFGDGFGSSIDAYGYAYLVTGESNLPYLHNGYYNSLLKSGIIGVILNILYYFVCLVRFGKTKMRTVDKRVLISAVLAAAFAAYAIGGVLIGYIVPIYAAICMWLPNVKDNE